ncbi:MAG: APC family permease [Gemmatimonadaceae bacterium]
MRFPSASDRSLVRALGVWGLAASIVNLIVGGGIFRLLSAAASTLGAAAPLAYVVCAVAMGLIVLCFAEAGSRVFTTGGLYAYVEVAYGPFVGFLVGVMLWAGITAATAAVASFFGDALGALVPAIAAGAPRAITLAVILAGFAALNVAGVRGANRVNAAMTVAKLVPLVALLVVGAASVHRGNLVWTSAPSVGGVARTSVVLIFAFLGIESALVPSGEVIEPARTVPRAIFIAMLGVTLLYLSVQIVAQGILGAALAGQKTPLAEAAAVAMGAPGRTLVLVGSTVSMLGYLGAMTLSAPRMLFALGRDGFLPSAFARVHARFHTPHIAIVAHVIVVFALAATGTFEKLSVIANGSVLLAYIACCAAVLELRRRGIRTEQEPFRVPFASAIPVLAILAIAWLLRSLAADEWNAMAIMVALAIVVYFAGLPARRTSGAAQAAETAA